VERTDEQLVRASIDGDPLSFGILVQRLRAPLIGYVTGLLGNKDDAEELAQDAFLIAWQKLPGLRVPARAKAWIYRVAHNLASKRRWQTRMEPLVDDPPAAITAGWSRANTSPARAETRSRGSWASRPAPYAAGFPARTPNCG
jgi:RNA polymerase sigma-70 factor (ECF subfamily)